ncbi:hypothetical protein LJB42_002136 [Komagataella kurtzmanii]|nr:hypothetical protein LJB42_002136 [Komagataella kurtzmanii]
MIPFEALIPYAIMFAGFCLGGGVMNSAITADITKKARGPNQEIKRNVGEDEGPRNYTKPRYNTDQWDKYFAVRDLRLTGSLRGQSDNAVAEESFKTNSIQPYSNTRRPWVLRRHIIMKNSPTKWARKYSSRRDEREQEIKDDYIRGMGEH